MGAEQGELSGPDLEQGVPLSALDDGEMLQGHAGGAPVLLARRGDEVFAIDALCPHYGAPLVGGILVDDTVRCPAHHAAFSLRTGDAVRAPALNPAGCWRVERSGDTVRVVGRAEPAPAPSDAPRKDGASTRPESVVILGAGAAGNAAAEQLRREGYDGRITLIGAEDSVPYDRPNLSKDYLAGNAPEEWIPLRSREFYEERGIDLVLGTRANRIEVAERRVRLLDGRTYPFDALLLAIGSDPIRLPVPTHTVRHVHYLRTLADSRAIIAEAREGRCALVVGGSFIALEAAASLRARGVEVHLVAPDAHPLERVLGAELGDHVRRLHEEHGVVFHLGESVAAVDDHTVTLKNGGTLSADFVVVGIGVRASVGLASWAGIALDRGGVAVNEYLETSIPGIYAAGDLARWPYAPAGGRIGSEHWVVAERQGQTAARNILGRRERFEAIPFFWSQHYDTVVQYVGHAERWDSVEVSGSIADGDCTVAYRLDGHTLAVATLSRDRVSLRAEVAMERHDAAALEALLAAGEVQHA